MHAHARNSILPAIGEKHLSPSNSHQRAGRQERAKIPISNGRISAMGGKVLQKKRMEREDWFTTPNHAAHSVGTTSWENREGMELSSRFKAGDQEVIRTMLETAEDDVEANREQFDRWLYSYNDMQLRFASTLVCAEMKYKELVQVGRPVLLPMTHTSFASTLTRAYPCMHAFVRFNF
jgi:hypothetical protein